MFISLFDFCKLKFSKYLQSSNLQHYLKFKNDMFEYKLLVFKENIKVWLIILIFCNLIERPFFKHFFYNPVRKKEKLTKNWQSVVIGRCKRVTDELVIGGNYFFYDFNLMFLNQIFWKYLHIFVHFYTLHHQRCADAKFCKTKKQIYETEWKVKEN